MAFHLFPAACEHCGAKLFVAFISVADECWICQTCREQELRQYPEDAPESPPPITTTGSRSRRRHPPATPWPQPPH